MYKMLLLLIFIINRVDILVCLKPLSNEMLARLESIVFETTPFIKPIFYAKKYRNIRIYKFRSETKLYHNSNNLIGHYVQSLCLLSKVCLLF